MLYHHLFIYINIQFILYMYQDLQFKKENLIRIQSQHNRVRIFILEKISDSSFLDISARRQPPRLLPFFTIVN